MREEPHELFSGEDAKQRLKVQATKLGQAPGSELAQETLSTEKLRVIVLLVIAIAILCDISERTVHKHLEHVYQKLGVETRTAAARRALTAEKQKRWSG